jgi:hypothetical protein
MFEFDLKLAGITFHTRSDLDRAFLHREAFKRFQVHDAQPNAALRFRSVGSENPAMPPLSQRELEQLSQCNAYPDNAWSTPMLRSPDVRARLQACNDHLDRVTLELRHSSLTILDFAESRLDAFYSPHLQDFFSRTYLGPIAFSPFLPSFSALILHSSGLVRNDSTALFLAPDEGGKTTVVTRSRSGIILCDDQVVLRRQRDRYMAYGTPWGSIVNSSIRAVLGGIFLLERARSFDLISTGPVQALEYIWREHMGCYALLPNYLRAKAFGLVYDVCRQTPIYRMRFHPDHVDWDAIDAAIGN